MRIEPCSHCPKDSVIYLHYAGRHLCREHFTRLFEKRFRTTVREFSMIRKDERVVVALSGGKDSSVLLHCLSNLKRDLPFELEAVTVDEGISRYRREAIKSARKEADKTGIEHRVISFKRRIGKNLDELVEKKTNTPCTICGVLRRRLLNDYAKEVGANQIAVGHNLDDVVQTLMMNIMRKEPSKLSSMVRQDGQGCLVPRIKPLLQSPEREVAAFAFLHEMDIIHPRCPYAHIAFRNIVRRSINEIEERYPGTKFKMLSSFLEIEQSLKKQYSEQAIGICRLCGSPSNADICRFCQMIRF